MSTGSCAQDVLRRDLCKTHNHPLYCDACHIKLCKSCEQCDIPICEKCVTSDEHQGHTFVEIEEVLTSKKERIKKDLEEIEKFISPNYQFARSNIPVQKDNAKSHSKRLTTELKNQGEAMHKEIDTAIQKMQSEIYDMNSKHLTMIDEQEKAINHKIAEIDEVILYLRKLLKTSDANLLYDYKSRNEEFRSLPAQFQVTLPVFTPHEVNKVQIYQLLGSVSKLDITTEENDNPMKHGRIESSPLPRPLIDEPRILTEINTEYGEGNALRSVSCLNDLELWTCGQDNSQRLYDLQGKLLNSVQTKSGRQPFDIALTQSRDIVYSDPNDRSINIVQNTKIQQLIRVRKWKPYYLCSTPSKDLLITMTSTEKEQSKVVRYSGSTEKQTIQWDDQGKALYSYADYPKYISENRNLDICVADNKAGAVVVVSAAGKLRFRYTGPPSTNKIPFSPVGITTDSQSRILTSDSNNDRIHILDQNGHFLRYIDNSDCDLHYPVGLYVDSSDNLFVAESFTGKVKKVQYYK